MAADLYSKVTLRPRSNLERVLELLETAGAVPKRADGSVTVQLVLFYLVAADVSPGDASRFVKHLRDDAGRLDARSLLALAGPDVSTFCPERNVPDLVAALQATGQAANDGLEDACRRDGEEGRRRLAALPRLGSESIDLILLSSGASATVAPSAPARRVAARLGYPGSTYAAIARALDAEIPEGDTTDLAWRAHHLLSKHGREVCLASSPRCHACSVRSSCSFRGEGPDPASRLSSPALGS